MESTDVIIGTSLPFLLKQPLDAHDHVMNLTVDEARRQPVVGLPVLMKHNDGEEYVVGSVEGVQMRRGQQDVLMTIDSCKSGVSRFVAKELAAGKYSALSLGHNVKTVRASKDGELQLEKTSLEISVCDRGMRDGSDIRHFFPSRATLRGLTTEELAQTAVKHGYAEALANQGVQPAERSEYIDAFFKLIKERHARYARDFATHPRVSPHTLAAMSETSTTVAASAETKAAETTPPQEPAAESEPTGQETESAAQGTMDTDVFRDPKKAADLYAQESERAAKIAQDKAAIEARLREYERQDAERKKAEEAALAKARDEAKSRAERAFAAFQQHAADSDMSEAEINGYKETFMEQINKDPIAAEKYIKPVAGIVVRAAEKNRHQNNMAVEQMARQIKNEDEAYLRKALARANAAKSMNFGTSFERNFEAPPVSQQSVPAPNATTPQPATSAPQASTSSSQAVAPPPATSVKVNASSDADWARQEFVELGERFGRIPTYDEVAYGVAFEATGTVRASYTGVQEPVMRAVRKRTTPKAISTSNFAPDLDQSINQALKRLRSEVARPL